MRARAHFMIVVVAAALVAGSWSLCAGANWIRYYTDPTVDIGCVLVPPVEYTNIYVVVGGDEPLSRVSLRETLGECGVYVVDYIPVFASTTGNPYIGFTIDFGGCYETPIHVLTLRVIGVPSECCYSAPVALEFVDCAGNQLPIGVGGLYTRIEGTRCVGGVPHDPSPPDFAVGVPTNVVISWQCERVPICELSSFETVYIGTSIESMRVWGNSSDYMELYNLDAGTTYYWQIVNTYTYGPIWRFTTAGPVSSNVSTWGRIKAMYTRQ